MIETAAERLEKQLQFVLEIDKLKQVIRRTYLVDGGRLENSAEHSWHLALMAIVLAEHANAAVDVTRVMKMALIHDLVEIDAGDTFLYDEEGAMDKAAREEKAASRLFAMLPPEQERAFLALWQEFEARESADARFANALDRLMPLLHNYHTRGKGWQENGVVWEQVVDRLQQMSQGSEAMWNYAAALIDDAAEQGFLPRRD